MNIYRVYPRFCVFNNEYVVVAENYGEAERMVIEIENKGGGDCEGIAKIEFDDVFNPDYPSRFVGVGAKQ